MLGSDLRDLLIDLERIAAGRGRQQALFDIAVRAGGKVHDTLFVRRVGRRWSGRCRRISASRVTVPAPVWMPILPGGSAGCGIGGGATEIGVSGTGCGFKAAISVSLTLSVQGGGLPVTLSYSRSTASGCIMVVAAPAPISKATTQAATSGQRRGRPKSCWT